MIYLTLFFEFFQIGTFAVGGGLAAIPFLFSMADRHPWFDHDMLVNMIAVSEIAPGPIGVKMSTYAGFSAAGIPGALAATMGLIVPGVIMMLLVVRVLSTINENKYMQNAFYGLRPAVTALIAWAAFEIARFTIIDFGDFQFHLLPLILLALLMLGAKYIKQMSPLVMICVAAVVGIVFQF